MFWQSTPIGVFSHSRDACASVTANLKWERRGGCLGGAVSER